MSGCECEPDAKRKRDSAQPTKGEAINTMSGCECEPDAKRKRDSAQPERRAKPSR